MKEKIKFKDLSAWLKISIIAGWSIFGLYIFYFILGMMELVLAN